MHGSHEMANLWGHMRDLASDANGSGCAMHICANLCEVFGDGQRCSLECVRGVNARMPMRFTRYVFIFIFLGFKDFAA